MSRRQPRQVERSPFGRRLFAARSESGLTQEQLARQIDVGVRLVQRWEKNGEPSAEYLARLCRVLGRDVAYFYAEPVVEEAA